MRICVILPVLRNRVFEEITYRELSAAKRGDTEITVVSLDKGPASIESAYDEEVAAPWILEKVKEAEAKGFDAIIINCMGDPALDAAREIVEIPVIGPCQTSLAIASTLGEKFSIIAVLKNAVPAFERLVRKYGFEDRLASIRFIEVPVLELEKRKEEVKNGLLLESRKAIEEDRADVVILGCTGLVGMARELKGALNIPVIDPAQASLKFAEILVDMKISHSKLVYPYPPRKERML